MEEICLAIAAIFISLCAFILSLRAYFYHKHEATLTGDSNIISFVSSVLDFFERFNKLADKERGLFIKLLEDSEYFEASEKGNLEPYYSVWSVDKLLREYFGVKPKS